MYLTIEILARIRNETRLKIVEMPMNIRQRNNSTKYNLLKHLSQFKLTFDFSGVLYFGKVKKNCVALWDGDVSGQSISGGRARRTLRKHKKQRKMTANN